MMEALDMVGALSDMGASGTLSGPMSLSTNMGVAAFMSSSAVGRPKAVPSVLLLPVADVGQAACGVGPGGRGILRCENGLISPRKSMERVPKQSRNQTLPLLSSGWPSGVERLKLVSIFARMKTTLVVLDIAHRKADLGCSAPIML